MCWRALASLVSPHWRGGRGRTTDGRTKTRFAPSQPHRGAPHTSLMWRHPSVVDHGEACPWALPRAPVTPWTDERGVCVPAAAIHPSLRQLPLLRSQHGAPQIVFRMFFACFSVSVSSMPSLPPFLSSNTGHRSALHHVRAVFVCLLFLFVCSYGSFHRYTCDTGHRRLFASSRPRGRLCCLLRATSAAHAVASTVSLE
jgi:hypothetical protein